MAKKKGAPVAVEVPDTVLIGVEDLQPSGFNPNEMAAAEFDALTEEIKEVGFIVPIQVVPMIDGSYRIIGGQHRWQVATALGMKKIPCVLLSSEKWKEIDLQKFVTVRLNMLHGRPNPDKMVAMYQEMAAKYGEESLQKLFTYTDQDAWKKLVAKVRKGLKDAKLPKGAVKKFDEDVKEAKSAEDLGFILNNLLNRYGDTLEYSFMVFSFGGKEHLYIAMNNRTKKAMDRVTEFCHSWSLDMNEILAEVAEKWVEAAEEREVLEMNAKKPALQEDQT